VEVISDVWKWIGENSDAIQAVCIVLSAVAAFLVIWHGGKVNRLKATVDLIRATFFEENARKSYDDFKKLLSDLDADNRNISEFAEPHGDRAEGNSIILKQINNYELISLGIKKNVFDEKFYKRWFYSQLTRDYDKVEPYIYAVREFFHNDAYFCEFQALAGRWKRNKHPVKHPPRWKIAYWVLSGQHERAQRGIAAE
jgi:hypothetical protein